MNFRSEYRHYFKLLNHEWISQYFEMEPYDHFVLENPEEAVLKNGGKIFFAQVDHEIVGTCSLTRINENIVELGKMAVRSDRQKLGIGRVMLLHAIIQAREERYNIMTLYSNTKLVNAINMYINAGFRLIPKTDFHSQRANIKMSLTL